VIGFKQQKRLPSNYLKLHTSMENLIKYLTVFILSMFKFIFGPLTGAGFGFSVLTTAMLTIGGMMSSVVLFTLAGTEFRKKIQSRFFKNRKRFTPRNRQTVRVWKKYGIKGVAFLTPLLFTPIGGTLIAVSFGEKKLRILVYMLVSALFWGIILSAIVILLGRNVLDGLVKLPN
jgi:hypothetical protein